MTATAEAKIPGLDSDMARALRHLHAKGFRPGHVADIGAARGSWSIGASVLFDEAVFHMFEPLEEHAEGLQKLCGSGPRFRHHMTGIGADEGDSTMLVSHDLDGSTMLRYDVDYGLPERRVPITTLDTLVDSGVMPQPDLVKIDVQGAEALVIAGGQRTIAAAEVLVIEVNLFRFTPACPLLHEIVAQVASLGHRVFDVAGQLRRPFENDLGQMDLVFVREGSGLIASDRWA